MVSLRSRSAVSALPLTRSCDCDQQGSVHPIALTLARFKGNLMECVIKAPFSATGRKARKFVSDLRALARYTWERKVNGELDVLKLTLKIGV